MSKTFTDEEGRKFITVNDHSNYDWGNEGYMIKPVKPQNYRVEAVRANQETDFTPAVSDSHAIRISFYDFSDRKTRAITEVLETIIGEILDERGWGQTRSTNAIEQAWQRLHNKP